MAEDSDKDPPVGKCAENITPTIEEKTLNSSLGSQENLQDYMDDSLVESLNKTDTELNNETMSVTSSDTNHAVTSQEDDLLSSPHLPAKYDRSQSCASNISNQSKGGFGEFCSVLISSPCSIRYPGVRLIIFLTKIILQPLQSQCPVL